MGYLCICASKYPHWHYGKKCQADNELQIMIKLWTRWHVFHLALFPTIHFNSSTHTSICEYVQMYFRVHSNIFVRMFERICQSKYFYSTLAAPGFQPCWIKLQIYVHHDPLKMGMKWKRMVCWIYYILFCQAVVWNTIIWIQIQFSSKYVVYLKSVSSVLYIYWTAAWKYSNWKNKMLYVNKMLN